MKNNEQTVFTAQVLEVFYELACQWEEEPEIYDPWQRNCDV